MNPPLLPRYATPLVGRAGVLAALGAAFEGGARWVTLVGPGGVGKTRAASAFAAARGAVTFVSLEAARSEGDVCAAVARALDVPLPQQPSSPAQWVAREVAAQGALLLLLDCTEHVASLLAPLLARWLAAAPRLSVLVTSRWPLGDAVERVVEVPPLSTDAPRGGLSDAAALLLALAPRPPDAARPEVRAAAENIARRLEGNALAIELAAARLEVLTLDGLRARLDERLKLLRDPRRPDARHGTLWNTIDWSWTLLEPWEQAALRQLSVFAGAFTVEAAEAVVALPDASVPVLDAIHALARRAMLRPEGDGRLRLYDLVRDYAAVRLAESGEQGATEARHGDWHLERCAAWAEAIEGPEGDEMVARLMSEQDDLVAIHRRALTARPATPATARRVIAAVRCLHPLLNAGLTAAETCTLVTEALALADAVGMAPTEPHALDLRRMLARVYRYLGDMDRCLDLLARTVELAREAGDRRQEARALGTEVEALTLLHRLPEAEARAHAVLAMHRAAGDRRGEGIVLSQLGLVHAERGEMDAAAACWTAALAHLEATHALFYVALVHNHLGSRELERGAVAAARRHFHTARQRYEKLRNRRAVAICEGYLALCDHHEDRLDEAHAAYRRVVERFAAMGELRFLAYYRYYLAMLHLERDEPDAALGLLGDARTALAGVGDRRYVALCRCAEAAAVIRAGEDPAPPLRAAEEALQAVHDPLLASLIDLPRGAAALGTPGAAAALARLAARPGDDAQLAARVLRAWMGLDEAEARMWRVAADGSWFQPPGGERVTLTHRPTLARLLAVLLAAPEGATRAELVEATWPGERLVPQSAGNRLRVAVSTLRSFGLEPLIERTAAGYRLAREAGIQTRPPEV